MSISPSHKFQSREQLLHKFWSERGEPVRWQDFPNPATFKRPTRLTSHPPRLFALLIGINIYQNAPPLRGAVLDALDFKYHLENLLSVPPEQITTLLNYSATRSEILHELRRLRDNSQIEKGDPILIYYAGYGGEVTYAENPKQAVEFIVPQDYCDNKENAVPAISQRAIGELVAEIAQIRSDNITIILDCSHSLSGMSSATPADAQVGTGVRSLLLNPTIHPTNLDQEIWSTEKPSQLINSGDGVATPSKTMIVKACGPLELARETYTGGSFTKALRRLLRNNAPHELRYSEILARIDQIPGQTPRIEGPNSGRALFDGKVLVTHQTCFRLAVTPEEILLHAGAIHGISPGAEFTIYSEADTLFQNPIGVLGIESISAFSSTLVFLTGAPHFAIDDKSLAVQTKAGEREDVRFYFPTDDLFLPCYDALLSIMQDDEQEMERICLVDDPKDAHIEIAMEDEQAIFLIRDERILQYGLTRLCGSVDLIAEEIAPVLRSVAQYYWKLNRENNEPEISNNVHLELYELEDSRSATAGGLVVGHVVPTGPNLCQNGVVDVIADGVTPYGLRLVNMSSYDLYPYLSFFDNSDLSIGVYYQPRLDNNGAAAAEAPLRKNGGTIDMGFGEKHASGCLYYLRDGQDIDLGFLKLFLSTKPLSLSTLAQPSPFETTRSEKKTQVKPPADTWGTVLIPVVQRRAPDPHSASRGAAHVDRLAFLESENQTLKRELVVHRDEMERLRKQNSDLSTQLEEVTRKKISDTKGRETPRRSYSVPLLKSSALSPHQLASRFLHFMQKGLSK